MIMRAAFLALFFGALAITSPDKLVIAKPALSSMGLGTFHDLASNGSEGFGLSSMIVGSDGHLYGTTYLGGSDGYGTFYKATATGNRQSPTTTYTVLHHFSDGSVTNDGKYCSGKLVQDGSSFIYGTCEQGGSSTNDGYGVVYRMEPSTGTVNILHRFLDGSVANDGGGPYSGLVMDGSGNLYGTTRIGGGTAQYGTIFKLSPTWGGTWSYSVLYRFTGGSGGEWPSSITLGSDGNLYGVAMLGGANDEGIIWRYNLSTSTFTKLIDTDVGQWAYTGLAEVPTSFTGGPLEFWGTSQYGGSNVAGTIYKITETSTSSGVFTYNKIHDFDTGNNEGWRPSGDLLFTDSLMWADSIGVLYGVTEYGGVSGDGSLFRIDRSGNYWEPPSDQAWMGGYPFHPSCLVQSKIGGGSYYYAPVLLGCSTGGPNGNGWLWHVWLWW